MQAKIRERYMPSDNRVPKRLYKYRSFSNWTLSMLVDDNIYYADPRTFNDPLDAKPNLAPDLDNAGLEEILVRLIEGRVHEEMKSAANAIRYKGPKTISHIARQSLKAAENRIASIRYYSTDPELKGGDPVQRLLALDIEEELLRIYTRGIVSLAERATCPLMWSHYGDQHRGICLGYSVPDSAVDVRKIRYGGSRAVLASDVAAMLAGDDVARQRVDEAVLLRKARPWAYEREWRLIGKQGALPSPLELQEVIFGMRCDSAVVYAVIQALAPRSRQVRFHEIREQRSKFVLTKRQVDVDEVANSRPHRSRELLEGLDDFQVQPSLR
jgi:hypothetical protein